MSDQLDLSNANPDSVILFRKFYDELDATELEQYQGVLEQFTELESRHAEAQRRIAEIKESIFVALEAGKEITEQLNAFRFALRERALLLKEISTASHNAFNLTFHISEKIGALLNQK